MQAMVLELGGRVEGAEVGEFGRSHLTVSEHGRLLAGVPDEQSCWMSHRDTVYEAPPGFAALAASTESPVAALESVGARAVRDPVPPRGRAHPLRHPDPRDLPPRRLRLRHGLERRLGGRGADRAHPRAGRRRARDLRPLRRGRLLGCGAADPSRRRRPAHLRLRRPRHDAQERGQPGRGRLPRPVQGAAGRRRRRGALPRPAGRRHRPRGASARSSARSSSASSRSRPSASATRATSSRARSTRT